MCVCIIRFAFVVPVFLLSYCFPSQTSFFSVADDACLACLCVQWAFSLHMAPGGRPTALLKKSRIDVRNFLPLFPAEDPSGTRGHHVCSVLSVECTIMIFTSVVAKHKWMHARKRLA